ncbi:peptide chain release factor N(5)-glutamine methyltransferase [Aureitalea marina]|uniref:peptide chain release factor N(5)-glutamine methyltransferase n=1 Tax=Aureitalea marina TaxID=930804 RepID=A0A2S7KTL5_9FLAO|nr:peptide chain release factor N(5)-glutamine methyltransferase [Aureitalea marina]PQB05936.1 protein-(glutamine-N5) methyltransferase, release factor-specific [Aureitalea marina]
MNNQQLRTQFISQRPDPMEGSEWEHLFYTLISDYAGLSRFQFVQQLNDETPVEVVHQVQIALQRLMDHEPIQYILGYTQFLDLTINVGPGVLIPRPETEEWVSMLISSESNSADDETIKVLEVGTGSGCIALSIKHHLAGAEVTALDLSLEALKIARGNAGKLGLNCEFLQMDFTKASPSGTFDVLVSNPPYVRRSEAQWMRPNVLEHEPDLALFVPDDDALLFYRHLAVKGRKLLNPGGRIYLEINEYLSVEVSELFEDQGYEQVQVHNDLFGKPRCLTAMF